MKKYINAVIKIVICILVSLNLTSCWSAHELNKLAIVIGMGIDKGKEDGYPVEMTVQIANVSGIKSSSKGKDAGANNAGYLNLKEKGKSISDTAKAFNRKLNRNLFFSHNQVVIFGKDFAEKGIENYMDFFLRYRETRLLTWILVSKQPASEILNVKPELEATPGKNIGELIKNQQQVSQIPAVNLKDFSSKLMSKTTAPTAPIVEFTEVDISVFIIILTITCIYTLKKGLEVIARVSFILGIVSIITAVFITILTIKDMHLSNFLPLFQINLKEFVQGTNLMMSIPFGEIVVFLMIFPYVNDIKKVKKSAFIGLIAGSIFFLSVIL